jgi:hypothetical protein
MSSELLYKLDKEDFEILATIVQRIWLRRNAVVFGGDFSNPTQFFINENDVLEEF